MFMADEQFNVTDIDKLKNKSEYRKEVGSARSAIYIILGLSFVIFLSIAAIAVLKEGVGRFLGTIASVKLHM